jgi:outer membrane murein-binding lipoprotein Lpp
VNPLRITSAVLLLILAALLLVAGCMEKANTTPISPAVPTLSIAQSDKELAEQTIAEAEAQIKKVDDIVRWFKGNASTRDDPQLAPFIVKREIAIGYIVSAEDEIANGNFSQAHSKALEAFAKANESYTEALKRQQTLSPDCQRGFFVMCL